MMQKIKYTLLFIAIGFASPSAFAGAAEIKAVDASPTGEEVRVAIELTSAVTPIIKTADNPSRLIVDFPNVAFEEQTRQIMVNKNGVGEVRVSSDSESPSGTIVSIGLDALRAYGIETSGGKLVLSIFRPPQKAVETNSALSANGADSVSSAITAECASEGRAPFSTSAPPEVEHLAVESTIAEPTAEASATVHRRFRVKFISGKTAYIDGGSNAGLRVGMNLDILDPHAGDAADEQSNSQDTAIASARIVGVATTSAVTEVSASNGELRVGDWADLTLADAADASRNVLNATAESYRAPSSSIEEEPDSLGPTRANSFRSTQQQEADLRSRVAGRVGFDYSGITSDGSSPGTSTQVGMSFQSDMTHILGTHWNLEGYWRGRTNRHSQFQEPTLEESLNKTYTMQLYYDNPASRWAAGVGRLYLPWAVGLDTIDGGYAGFKPRPGMITGIFGGSTPDLSSWHYRPNQRIAGWFMNFEGGDYDRFRYSSTTGAALSSVGWKLDRPFVFFENEASYRGKVSTYHSLIADSPQGASTHGIRPGAGISRSYFTFHYVANRVVSLDFYHNYFRDVPTALTPIVGTGLVDKLLFQGVSGGVRVKPMRQFTLYSTIGTSAKTGDLHRSLNQMYGATWNEIGHSGIRADFHYSKFDSNFAEGNYRMLSLARQLTNRMYWNVQLGAQHVESMHTMDCDSLFFDDSLDINLGRHSYLQSGYTYVNGETMNYRQWYMSWGYRFDQGRRNPEFVQSMMSR